MEGVKYDEGKLRFDLVPINAVTELAKVLSFGAAKYAPNGWQKVEDPINRYYAALLRHLFAWRAGEKIDPESGLSHLSHVITNVVFLLEFELNKEL